MQRNLELVKKVLIRVEGFPFKVTKDFDYSLKINSYSEDEIKIVYESII